MEMSTPENEELVSRVYTQALEARADGQKLSAADTVVYEVEMLSQEVNSGRRSSNISAGRRSRRSAGFWTGWNPSGSRRWRS